MNKLYPLRRRMAAAGINSLLVTNPANLRYLFGISDLRWALVTLSSASVMPFHLGEEAARAVIRRPVRLMDPDGAWTLIPGLLEKRGGMRLGVEASTMSVDLHQSLGRALGSRVLLVRASGIVETCREIKTAEEIVMIKKAARISAQVLAGLERFASCGKSEREIAVFIDNTMREKGADGPAFETIALAGPRSAYPHGKPSGKTLGRGDLLLVDFGARCGGYCSDITRVYAMSRRTPRQEKVYDAVFRSYEAGRKPLRAGCTAEKPYWASRRALGRLAVRFIHGLGHGVGLEIHEGPRLAGGEKAALKNGNIVTVEPGVYFPGWGGIRLEDSFLVRSGDSVSLTGAPSRRLPLIP